VAVYIIIRFTHFRAHSQHHISFRQKLAHGRIGDVGAARQGMARWQHALGVVGERCGGTQPFDQGLCFLGRIHRAAA